MDLRQWLVLNDLPKRSEMPDIVKHVPNTEHRTDNIMRLFIAGYRTGFKLTNRRGEPTDLLRLMVLMMKSPADPDVSLGLFRDLPETELQAFQKNGLHAEDWWCLTGLTGRIKGARGDMRYNWWPWAHHFLPGLTSAHSRYLDPDGKRRRRLCNIAICPTNWEVNEYVYEGLYRWNYEHRGGFDGYKYRPSKLIDGYAFLGADTALGSAAGERAGERASDAVGAFA